MKKPKNEIKNNEERVEDFDSKNIFDFYSKKHNFTQELLNVFEAFSYNKTYESIRNTTNWFFAMSLAVLLWFLGNFDKFVVNGKFINKPLFIISLVIIVISVSFFALIRIFLHLRRFVVTNFIEDVKLFPLKIWLNRENLDDGEFQKKWSDIIQQGFSKILDFTNLINKFVDIIELGMKIFLFGLSLLVIYLFTFIIYYI